MNIPDGTQVLVTLLKGDAEPSFWNRISQISLEKVWDNTEDDIYAELLEK